MLELYWLGTIFQMVQSNCLRLLKPTQIQLRLSQSLKVVALSINDGKVDSIIPYRKTNLVNFEIFKVVIGPTHLWHC